MTKLQPFWLTSYHHGKEPSPITMDSHDISNSMQKRWCWMCDNLKILLSITWSQKFFSFIIMDSHNTNHCLQEDGNISLDQGYIDGTLIYRLILVLVSKNWSLRIDRPRYICTYHHLRISSLNYELTWDQQSHAKKMASKAWEAKVLLFSTSS